MKKQQTHFKFKNSNKSLAVILTILFFLLTSFSCQKKDKKTPFFPPKTYSLRLNFNKDEPIIYTLSLNSKGTVFYNHPDPEKQEHIPDHINQDFKLELVGNDENQARVNMILEKGDEDVSIFSDQIDAVLTDSGRSTGEGVDTGRFLTIFFALPEKAVRKGESWKVNMDKYDNSEGFIRSKIVGTERINGETHLKIETVFRIKENRGGSFMIFHGEGTSLFSEKQGTFARIERDYKLNINYKKNTKGSVEIEQVGKIILTTNE